jgi:hypothetical protein
MKVEVEYFVKKRTTIECNDIDDVMNKLLKTDWANGNRTIERKPRIEGKLILDSEITFYNKEEGCHNIKEGAIQRTKIKIECEKDWIELLEKNVKKILTDCPWFSEEKARFLAKQDMPDFPSDGWI